MVSEHASPLATLGGVDAGGQNVHVTALARALAGRGHHIDVYTRRDAWDLPDRVPLCPGVDVVHVPAGPAEPVPKDELPPYMPAFGRWLTDAWSPARRPAGARPGPRRPDVVHAHFWMSGVAALAAGRAVGVPVVQTFHALGSVKRRHQGAADTSPADRIDTETRLALEVDVVVATCTDELAELARLGTPVERVQVVPCGVDLEHFTPQGPVGTVRRLGRSPAYPHRLLAVGRLVERKGLETVVRALVRLPGAELVVAGGPPLDRLDADPEAVRLTALARRLGVGERLRLVGEVGRGDLPALMRSADVVVATPWYEPFGIVPLEAMACGRPLVGTAVGGLLDTVVPGVTGVLVRPRDPDALAAAVAPLLADPDARAGMGAAARARAVARYGWPRVARDTEAAYAAVASSSRLWSVEAV
jgi:glycosyltransferase involved in cell wall biosynthesis